MIGIQAILLNMSIEFSTVCGLDEAGRGSLAGPMVLAAIILRDGFSFGDVAPEVVMRDSKQLSFKQREKAFELIEKYSLAIELEVMTVEEINRMGVGWANVEGFRRLIKRIKADKYIVDGRLHLGRLDEKTELVTCMVDADEIIPSTMSAGIVAKYRRDQIMQELHKQYPDYGWNTNTGHGTQQHIDAIRKYGINEHHRFRFVETALKNSSDRLKLR